MDINFNAAIAFYVEIAIASEDKIDLIEFLKDKEIKLIKVVININR